MYSSVYLHGKLRSRLAKDGEAAVGHRGANQAAHRDDHEDHAHPLQVLSHLLLRLEEACTAPHGAGSRNVAGLRT